MNKKHMPEVFGQLHAKGYIKETDILKTQDGFWLLYKSLADILLEKGILDVPGLGIERILCSRFFDDWFLYAVPDKTGYVYSLLKLREQEHDAQDGAPADGDTPGVTISFICFACSILFDCLEDPTDENRTKLDEEINRVVVYRGQCHHKALKKYFIDPRSEGAYLVGSLYARHIVSCAGGGVLDVPDHYKKIVQKSSLHKKSKRACRLPRFIKELNEKAGRAVCDNEKIYIKNREEPDAYESAAILATHTANTSLYSFAAEVEYHARFLISAAKINIPFLGRSVYDSAIRADMTIEDTELEGPAPFYRSGSKIVKRQYKLHREAKNGWE